MQPTATAVQGAAERPAGQGSPSPPAPRGAAPPERPLEGPPALLTPWVESPFFERELEARRDRLTPEELALATAYHRDGVVLLDQCVPHDLCDRVRAEVTPLCEEPFALEHRRVPDAWKRGAPSVLELARYPKVREAVAMLYERRPIPFQTLTFKLGTQQELHSDAIHFTCLPERFMCGAWVALEDVDEGNGPLLYYPGSHRVSGLAAYEVGLSVEELRYDRHETVWHELMRELGIKPVEVHAKKGDVLVWASDILHGGKRVERVGSTRWSQVTHFYFERCLYYAPVASDLFAGELLLKDVVDLVTMEPVPHSYDGEPVRVVPLENGRSRVSLARTPASPEAGEASRLAALEGELARARAEAAQAREDVAAVRGSVSYRLGNALVGVAGSLRRFGRPR